MTANQQRSDIARQHHATVLSTTARDLARQLAEAAEDLRLAQVELAGGGIPAHRIRTATTALAVAAGTAGHLRGLRELAAYAPELTPSPVSPEER